MPTDHRVFLNVPFAAKSEAKARGAKWDPGRRQWWIPKRFDMTPFRQWLPRDIADPASCATFPAERTLDIDELHDLLSYPALTVFFAPDTCWRCHMESWVLALYCHNSNDIDNAMAANLAAVLWPETLPALTAAYGHLKLPAIGTIKNRFSNTLGTEYFSQGCAHCDALFGDFILYQQTWPQIWASQSKSTYLFQAPLPWPVQAAVDADRSLTRLWPQAEDFTPGFSITSINGHS